MNDDAALSMLVALAQETRLAVLLTLLRHLPDGVSAGRLAEAVGCAPSTLSFHVQHLAGAGLVRSHRQAQSVVYFAVPDTVGGLTTFLTRECCQGRPESCGLPPVGRMTQGQGCS
ncbi:ArsR/SmtB family transcription factor [Methylorubrum salsuginis]|uniref:Transcriptional regulator, ArsR family n=1 Tax=Methylorubrum salsuginis TaxID=414703 RepID=A0A1I4JZ24_9HYPH|nr:metalloregulator ArsR/SmtB family transcription factor [Methylorubrum salsuginis]SFL71517.1 transcriptional regulator, ArsR family [Methylorubrum salsuginis]